MPEDRKLTEVSTAPRPTSRQRIGKARRSPKENVVQAQFGDPITVTGYAASYQDHGPAARYFHSRLHAVTDALQHCTGGELIDVGCGPGMFARALSESRPHHFRITALDQSAAMIEEAASRLSKIPDIRLSVGQAETIPFGEASFDVVVAMGVLEYCDAELALREFARVARPGGLILVTMLNPLSPYRIFEWVLYWPFLRLLGRIERALGRTSGMSHGAPKSGIRAIPARTLRRLMNKTGLHVDDIVHYDITALLPPVDKFVHRSTRRWREHPERTVSRGARRCLGSAYLVVAHRIGPPSGPDHG
ncbi:class I SAM-dependent methyltransferase [Amycolatopsis sp. H20-H5]|uniref:class I SAM-dependent methyltransferase n=1 Tax=Amycolatopsis sp. H20-H5 TaxID=3046309 RepID=UPI002DBF3E0C|nr:methyltransferase domain-containing protein [Amycolatopsis sp. H20-H5]MEC3974400.1 methyltransferase domain-containing protein [Amycolatopsis sp. H20-H5]